MERASFPQQLPPSNPPRFVPPTRQRWVFLLLVGASSFMAFHAFYTSMSLQDRLEDGHYESFHPPIQDKRKRKETATTKSTTQSTDTSQEQQPGQKVEQRRQVEQQQQESPPVQAQRNEKVQEQSDQQQSNANVTKQQQDGSQAGKDDQQQKTTPEEEQLQKRNQQQTSDKGENDEGKTPPNQEQRADAEAVNRQQSAQVVKESTSPKSEQKNQQQEQQQNAVVNNNNKPLNILVFYGDDWRHDQLGHLNPLIHSPVIDHELAGKGVRFTHNCVTTSICGVSRATYYTGQYMSRHGTNRTIELVRPWPELFPYFLKQAGYHIGYVGKGGLFPFHFENYDTCNMFEGYHIDENEDNGRHITQRAEDEAITYLSTRPMDKPFYLTVAFYATHAVDEDPRQYIPMNHSMALYQDTVIPIPITATEESWRRMPPFFSEHNEARRRWHKRFDEPEKHQRMMKNYYRLITEVDTVIGNVLKVLEEQNAINNTLIIFTTDNGNFHSEHGLADKFYPHEESIRVPLIIRDPRMADGLRNTTNDAFTLNVDLAATILSAANVTVPDYYQGRDVSELYLPKPYMIQRPWRTEFFYEFPGLHDDWVPASQALVRKEHKYMLWTDHDFEQFFDLVRDPIEDHDVFNETEYQDIISEMKARFLELREEAK